MDAYAVPKRQRNSQQHVGVVDRVSALPDFILGDVLSFLPTKQAVATSILSKRWKSAWLKVRNLDFLHDNISSEIQNDVKFIEFVYRVLFLHNRGLLNKFSLALFKPHCILLHFATSWINFAVARNIQYLDLSIMTHERFEVPISVFSCVSLQVLELTVGCVISLPTSFVVSLPRLNKLLLMGVRFQSEHDLEKLINGCPMLYDLYLLLYRCDFTYIISSSSLRRLSIQTLHEYYTLKIEAPLLEYLQLNGCGVPLHFVFTNPSSRLEVDFAFFHLDRDEYDSIVEAISVFDWANALTLSAKTMMALSHGTVNLSTKFNNLVKLRTDIGYCDGRLLQDLIQRSDNLQFLMIYQDLNSEKIDGRKRFNWTTPAVIPRCLSKSLKRIVFDGYHGNVKGETEMIQYMLSHGSVLEVMQISCVGEMNSSKLMAVQEIGEYPRKSPFCVVKFLGSTSSNNVEVCFTARPST